MRPSQLPCPRWMTCRMTSLTDLAQLTFLTDAELWQAAQTTLARTGLPKRTQALKFMRQREGLTSAGEQE